MEYQQQYMDKKIIIKALKSGVPVRRIAKELSIAERTLWRRIEKDTELQHAKTQFEAYIVNLFES